MSENNNEQTAVPLLPCNVATDEDLHAHFEKKAGRTKRWLRLQRDEEEKSEQTLPIGLIFIPNSKVFIMAPELGVLF